jgi:hypothetical protein
LRLNDARNCFGDGRTTNHTLEQAHTHRYAPEFAHPVALNATPRFAPQKFVRGYTGNDVELEALARRKSAFAQFCFLKLNALDADDRIVAIYEFLNAVEHGAQIDHENDCIFRDEIPYDKVEPLPPDALKRERIDALIYAHAKHSDDAKIWRIKKNIRHAIAGIPKTLHEPLLVQLVLRHFCDGGTYKSARAWLYDFARKYGKYSFGIDIDASDSEICQYADEFAQLCQSLPYDRQRVEFAKKHHVFLERGQSIARLSNAYFWRQKIRQQLRRTREFAHIGVIPTRLRIISNLGLRESVQQDLRHELWLFTHLAVNKNTGRVSELPSVDDAAKRRYASLFNRGAGMAQMAKDNGMHHILRADVTLGREWHPTTTNNGKRRENVHYNGKTPRQAKEHFERLLEAFTTAAKRRGVKIAYMLAPEPHKDETPHFHFLFFTNDEMGLRELLYQYFYWRDPEVLRDGEDHEYYKNVRVKIKPINDEAHAIAYISKTISYTAKYAVGSAKDGVENERFNDEAERAKAWRRTWGIRGVRFTVSGATVYEYLRKVSADDYPRLREIIEFAQDGDFYNTVKMANNLDIRSFYEMRQNRYGENVRRFCALIDGNGNVIQKQQFDIVERKIERDEAHGEVPPDAQSGHQRLRERLSELFNYPKKKCDWGDFLTVYFDTHVSKTDVYIALLQNGHVRPPP